MKIIDYKIVSDNDLGSLESQINCLISNGWTPLGGIAIRTGETGCAEYCQAMAEYL